MQTFLKVGCVKEGEATLTYYVAVLAEAGGNPTASSSTHPAFSTSPGRDHDEKSPSVQCVECSNTIKLRRYLSSDLDSTVSDTRVRNAQAGLAGGGTGKSFTSGGFSSAGIEI